MTRAPATDATAELLRRAHCADGSLTLANFEMIVCPHLPEIGMPRRPCTVRQTSQRNADAAIQRAADVAFACWQQQSASQSDDYQGPTAYENIFVGTFPDHPGTAEMLRYGARRALNVIHSHAVPWRANAGAMELIGGEALYFAESGINAWLPLSTPFCDLGIGRCDEDIHGREVSRVLRGFIVSVVEPRFPALPNRPFRDTLTRDEMNSLHDRLAAAFNDRSEQREPLPRYWYDVFRQRFPDSPHLATLSERFAVDVQTVCADSVRHARGAERHAATLRCLAMYPGTSVARSVAEQMIRHAVREARRARTAEALRPIVRNLLAVAALETGDLHASAGDAIAEILRRKASLADPIQARRFLARFPDHPQRDDVRQVIGPVTLEDCQETCTVRAGPQTSYCIAEGQPDGVCEAMLRECRSRCVRAVAAQMQRERGSQDSERCRAECIVRNLSCANTQPEAVCDMIIRNCQSNCL